MTGTTAYVPQTERYRLDFPVSALDVALMGAYSRARPGTARSAGSSERGARRRSTGSDWAGRPASSFGSLSGGQRQRVLIARALVRDASVILLDEPLSGVDHPSGERILTILRELRDEGRTLLVSSHDIEQAKRFDAVLCLNGRQVYLRATRRHDRGRPPRDLRRRDRRPRLRRGSDRRPAPPPLDDRSPTPTHADEPPDAAQLVVLVGSRPFRPLRLLRPRSAWSGGPPRTRGHRTDHLMVALLTEPLRDGITQRAILELLILAVVCGPLGVWVVLYRQSYATESIAHSMLPGLVIASLASIPLGLGAAAGLAVAADLHRRGIAPARGRRRRRRRGHGHGACSGSARCSPSRRTSRCGSARSSSVTRSQSRPATSRRRPRSPSSPFSPSPAAIAR